MAWSPAEQPINAQPAVFSASPRLHAVLPGQLVASPCAAQMRHGESRINGNGADTRAQRLAPLSRPAIDMQEEHVGKRGYLSLSLRCYPIRACRRHDRTSQQRQRGWLRHHWHRRAQRVRGRDGGAVRDLGNASSGRLGGARSLTRHQPFRDNSSDRKTLISTRGP